MPRDDELTAAWRAYEQGDLAACLARAERATSADARALAALARIEGGDYAGARMRLSEAERDGQRSPDLDFAFAELALREWRLDEARAAFEELARHERDASVAARLALLADLDGDAPGADAWLARARDLEPDAYPPPPRLDADAFEALVAEAAAQLPAEFRRVLADVRVWIDPMPTFDLVDPTDLAETPPDILGLFVGASDLDRSNLESGFELPPTIHLFQRNLERACPDEATLAHEIAITLWHELAHKLGFDEDGVDELGLG